MNGKPQRFPGSVVVLAASIPVATTLAIVVLYDTPGWLFMWLLAILVFFVLKLMTLNTVTKVASAPSRSCAYLFAWPGLNATQFLCTPFRPVTLSLRDWTGGAVELLLGGVIFWNARRWIPTSAPIALGWAGLVGCGFMLHFGLFRFLSCLWRTAGIDARLLMVAPLRATSVADFWGKRWNTAFRDFAHQFLFRPIALRCGANVALLATFLFSGLLHDLVISIPAGGGYGLPTVFFLIQALATKFEKSTIGIRLGLGIAWRGWLFTAFVLLMPARLLFHDSFITNVVVPFMKVLGAA
jgi:membrane bound O-acyltransferase family protein